MIIMEYNDYSMSINFVQALYIPFQDSLGELSKMCIAHFRKLSERILSFILMARISIQLGVTVAIDAIVDGITAQEGTQADADKDP